MVVLKLFTVGLLKKNRIVLNFTIMRNFTIGYITIFVVVYTTCSSLYSDIY